ncbi:hypothetical protein BN1708_011101 [Verticillium longisporum]|uniref:GDP-Man:Man(3)GlcNAc(2)-PP-Dol alpha-1,2-mannosyltransferase n=1 Tax=Verticillium longisporum TaxID=100787 RepID=A0A0G4KWP9_VERLO|nr:hypothetical protein BN1708_011101 [Verticillium longisporum]
MADTSEAGHSASPDTSTSGHSTVLWAVTVVAALPILALFVIPLLARGLGAVAGSYLRTKTEGRRAQLIKAMATEENTYKEKGITTPKGIINIDKVEDWSGIVGFFHPFCNAGGGGERVLWSAVRATQQKWPKALCVVYTTDQKVNKTEMVTLAKRRFNIDIHPPSLVLMYLSTKHLVLASTWTHFTLLGQSLGSMVMAWDAFQLLVPDVLVDTMGYAFVLGLSKLLFPTIPTGAYVHYPTISTDMLESLDPKSANGSQGINAGKGVGLRGQTKRAYWKLFAELYSRVGSTIDVVMTNSTWTQGHIAALWGPHRSVKSDPIAVVYPPCPVEELARDIEVSEASEAQRQKVIIYIAQFRPEKNHQLILQSFAEFLKTETEATKDVRLVLVGSVRDDIDSKRVYQLRLLVNELGIKGQVSFHLDATWEEILVWLQKAYVGVNGMWNEHFGIGCVEYQAAGVISVVHASGGPKLDINVDIDGEPTGFHASTSTEFAAGFEKALTVKDPLAFRLRAVKSAQRFTEQAFVDSWNKHLETLLAKLR